MDERDQIVSSGWDINIIIWGNMQRKEKNIKRLKIIICSNMEELSVHSDLRMTETEDVYN